MYLSMLLLQFEQRFPTDHSCFSYLFMLKWPNGYRCPRCQSSSAYTISTRHLPLYECRSCHHQATLTSNTILEKSRTSLRKWVLTMFLVAQANSSINAVWLSEQLSVSYKTAWTMLHKIRKAIHEFDTQYLLEGSGRGALECYGKPHNPTILRHPQEHPVLVSASHQTNQMTYYKFKVIASEYLNEKSVTPCGEHSLKLAHIASSIRDLFVIDKRFRLADSRYIRSLFKKTCTKINNTFHGIGRNYLQYYLDEHCYRLNHFHIHDLVAHLTSLCLSIPAKASTDIKAEDHLFAAA